MLPLDGGGDRGAAAVEGMSVGAHTCVGVHARS